MKSFSIRVILAVLVSGALLIEASPHPAVPPIGKREGLQGRARGTGTSTTATAAAAAVAVKAAKTSTTAAAQVAAAAGKTTPAAGKTTTTAGKAKTTTAAVSKFTSLYYLSLELNISRYWRQEYQVNFTRPLQQPRHLMPQ